MLKARQGWMYAGAFALVAAGVGYLVVSGISQEKMYFLNVREALAMPAGQSHPARLFGLVLAEGLDRPASGLGANFVLQDKDDPSQRLLVRYSGAVPDTFKPGVEVIVEGTLSGTTFDATVLMTKCPSKYQKDEQGRMRPPGYTGS
ncbi:MAG: cytochrome c maturation protein CcmE [Desulfomicrobiaceae bacterium]